MFDRDKAAGDLSCIEAPLRGLTAREDENRGDDGMVDLHHKLTCSFGVTAVYFPWAGSARPRDKSIYFTIQQHGLSVGANHRFARPPTRDFCEGLVDLVEAEAVRDQLMEWEAFSSCL